LAEFIVASALGIDLSIPREEWSAWDLTSPEGIQIEVKSAAYLQSWTQQNLSKIVFSIRPAQPWNSTTGGFTDKSQRSADVYIFCLLKHQDKETLNPLDLDQWEFYILSTAELNRHRHDNATISLQSLQKLTEGIPFRHIRETLLSTKIDK
jgi:hypothetical protein